MSLKPFVTFFLFSIPTIALFAQGTPEYNKWIMKGFELYSTGQYKASAQAYSKAFASTRGNAEPEDRYNAMCSWSMAGNIDSALFHLDYLATKANFTDHKHLIVDSDLNALHNDKRWARLCELVKQNKERSENLLDKSLVAILDTVSQNDQQGRRQIEATATKFGMNSPEMKALWKTINSSDSVNLLKVTAILDKYGWAGPEVVGEEGSATLFLVIQHASLRTQDKYLPMMRNAVKKGKADPSSLAMLEDRVAIGHHQLQSYGSQITTDPGGDFLAPLKDPDNVDKRRAAVGLGPISEYLQSFNLKWNIAEYKKQLPDYIKRQAKID